MFNTKQNERNIVKYWIIKGMVAIYFLIHVLEVDFHDSQLLTNMSQLKIFKHFTRRSIYVLLIKQNALRKILNTKLPCTNLHQLLVFRVLFNLSRSI